MFLYVQVCVRTRIVWSSDLKQSSEHLNCSEFGSELSSEHVWMVSTWVNISQAVVGTRLQKSEHPNLDPNNHPNIQTSDHVRMVSTWVNISQAVVGTRQCSDGHNSDDMQVKWKFGPAFRSERRSDPPPRLELADRFNPSEA